MTDGTFEAFRKAEALMAQRRPLDALRELKQVLAEAGEAPSVQLLVEPGLSRVRAAQQG